jgi:hypothetical protein
MSTPVEHVESMKELAEKIENHPYIRSAYIDDWGRFSNFTLILEPENWTRGTTNKLKGIVRQMLADTSAHLRDTFPPEFTGLNQLSERIYHCGFWKFDIDYHDYVPEDNVFIKDTGHVLQD